MSKKDDYKWFWNSLNSYLAANQLKQSKQRNIVIETFLNSAKHIDAEKLHEILHAHNHNIGLATIYRTLNLLKEAKLVEQNSFGDGRSVFEINHPNDHHDHLVCLNCQKVIEFENDRIEALQLELTKNLGFELASHRLDLYAYCTKTDCEHKKTIDQN